MGNLLTARPIQAGLIDVTVQPQLLAGLSKGIQQGSQIAARAEAIRAQQLKNQQAEQDAFLKDVGGIGQQLAAAQTGDERAAIIRKAEEGFQGNERVLSVLRDAQEMNNDLGRFDELTQLSQTAADTARQRGLLTTVSKQDAPFAVTQRLNEQGQEETGFITKGGRFVSIGLTGELTGEAKLKAQSAAAANRKRAELEAKAETPEGIAKAEKAELEAVKRREDIFGKSLQFDDATTKIDKSIESLEALLNDPGLSAAVGAKGPSSLFGLRETPIAGTEAADFVARLDTVKSQQFLEAVEAMRGLGTLTEREGAKVESAAGTLSRDQSEPAFINNANIVLRNLKAAREKIKKRSADFNKRNQKILSEQQTQEQSQQASPDTVLFSSPQFGDVTEADIQLTLEANPGLTREQVIARIQAGG